MGPVGSYESIWEQINSYDWQFCLAQGIICLILPSRKSYWIPGQLHVSPFWEKLVKPKDCWLHFTQSNKLPCLSIVLSPTVILCYTLGTKTLKNTLRYDFINSLKIPGDISENQITVKTMLNIRICNFYQIWPINMTHHLKDKIIHNLKTELFKTL